MPEGDPGGRVDDVIITPELERRPRPAPDYRAESETLSALAREMAERPLGLLQKLTDMIVALNIADSAGISLREEADDGERFRWTALSGMWSRFRNGTMPVDASPCGVVIQRNTTLLFEHPERVFPAARAEPPIHEILLVPFHVEERVVGTLWIVAHGPERKFNAEDARLLASLSRFASAAHRMGQALEAARAGHAELERHVEERTDAFREQGRALSESEERFRQFGEASLDVLWIRDAETLELEYTSPAFEAIYGRARQDIGPGMDSWLSTIHPDDRARVLTNLARIRAGERLIHEFRTVWPDGTVRWMRNTDFPIRDEAGRITRIGGMGHDATAGKLAADALRESEERFRSFADATSDVIWIVDARTMALEYLSPAYERMWDEPRDQVMADLSHWGDSVHPEDRPPPGHGLQALLAGQQYTAEYRIIRHDGSVRYIRDTGFPIFDDAGEVRRVAGVAQDQTERREAERALAESERRARTLIEGVPQLVWRSRNGGHWTWASPQWTALTGQPESASHGQGWLEALHPDDRDAAMGAWAAVDGADGFEVDYRLKVQDDGYRWFHTRATSVRDESGEVVEWLGTSTDVDELYRLQRHQRVLLAELQHRVRNTLGVVRSIVRRTAETADDVEDMSAHLQGRLDAFSRVQSAVTRDPGGKVDLATLVEDELLAHATRESTGTRIKGPSVRLEPRIAEGLSLALHELTTNAVKYGALGSDTGRLAVSWKVARPDGAEQLELLWQELGLESPPEEPQRRGFGLELLERQLPYELDATTRAEFLPTGFRFTLQMPLDSAEEDRERLLKRRPTHVI